MDAKLQRIEVEAAAMRYHDFAVDHTFRRRLCTKWIEHIGEVAVKWLLVAALDENFVAVTKNQNPEAIPLWLVDIVSLPRHLVHAFGKHGKNGRVDGQVH